MSALKILKKSSFINIMSSSKSLDDDPAEMEILPTKVPLLDFEKQIFTDIIEHDAIVIIAKGLNYNSIVTNFLWVYNDPGNLVIVVNSSDSEEKYYSDKLNFEALPTIGTEREKAYLNGGVHFVSTRILVVDLLKSRIPIKNITGMVVLRAHSVLESCQEAFALRLYRQKNKTGFIKAFSNSPISFTFGYGHVEKVMRSLFVKELFLWPRFHGSVIKCLKSRQAQVVEIHVSLSSNMAQIQTCLLDIMNYTTKMVKNINRTIDLQEITTENCLTKKFHKILQSQLDAMWHQLSSRTKEYIQDLKVLRSMMISLIHQDPVSFYSLVSKYRTPEYAQVNSGWILLDTADQLFKLSKGRVFNSKNEFDPEPCPKWHSLNEVLTKDIPEDLKKNKKMNETTKILILCQDNKTCYQLNQFLTMGGNKFLFYIAQNLLTINKIASRFKNLEKNTDIKNKQGSGKSDLKSNSTNSEQKDEGLAEDELDFENMDRSSYLLTLTQVATEENRSADANQTVFEPFSQMENMDMSSLEADNPVISIQTFKENNDHFSLETTLAAFQPQYIIMYQGDVAALRQIEMYECRKSADKPVTKLFFIIHGQTVEEQSYLTSLKREKQAFELLIQNKSVMAIPAYQDGKTDECFVIHEEEKEESMDTRKAGGQSTVKQQQQIIVDMREFRSDLPALLHKKGIAIEPVTISIGDYILTPDICVERKSLSDLIGSLNSGRLYTQATQMCRNYARPILLIEFDQNRPFNLQGHYVVSTDMSGADIQQKLQLLTLHFPRLKLVWSPSPYATAELFYELKQGRNNPDTASAIAQGGEDSEDLTFERYNLAVHDFVQKLPGVTSKNISRIMNKGVSLEHLTTLTKDELIAIVENKSEAEMLYSILHVQARPGDIVSKDDKPKRKYTGKIFSNRK